MANSYGEKPTLPNTSIIYCIKLITATAWVQKAAITTAKGGRSERDSSGASCAKHSDAVRARQALAREVLKPRIARRQKKEPAHEVCRLFFLPARPKM